MSEPKKPDAYDYIGYFLAAAILLPLGWWLKSNELFGFGEWVVSKFH